MTAGGWDKVAMQPATGSGQYGPVHLPNPEQMKLMNNASGQWPAVESFGLHLNETWQQYAASLFSNYTYDIDKAGSYQVRDGYYYNNGPGRALNLFAKELEASRKKSAEAAVSGYQNWPYVQPEKNPKEKQFAGPWWIPVGTGGYYSYTNPFPGEAYSYSDWSSGGAKFAINYKKEQNALQGSVTMESIE
jgi:hypothetical protein